MAPVPETKYSWKRSGPGILPMGRWPMDMHLDEMEMSLTYRILKNRLGELRSEIHHDHGSGSRNYLKHKEAIITRILGKFPDNLDETAHQKGFMIKS
jgi:hypothetical protein